MKRVRVTIVAVVLAIVMAMPMLVIANSYDEIPLRVEDGAIYLPLRITSYALGATVDWDYETQTVLITGQDGVTHTIVVEEVGGFIEYGVSWVPLEFVDNVLVALLYVEYVPQRVERIDLTLWERERFEDVREASFSTDLPHGVIAVNFIEYMSDNLGARSAFTYRELETAVWIVEELLAMGHDWDNIAIQEFTYWGVNDLGLGLFPLSWNTVTSPMILGVGREYQLRADRVSQNVVLTLPGQSERKIVVGAHYDSPPYASASDNASGTALLLESAQRMLELEHYYTIVYVFFGAEEVGLIGAYYYLESLAQAQRDNIVMMVNADVLIEGPYVIYGAGSMPEVTYDLIAYLHVAILEAAMDIFIMQFESIMADVEAMGIDPRLVLPFYTLEGYLELVSYDIAALPIPILLMQASMLDLLEPVICSVAQQVSDIAIELTNRYDFELISIPEAIAFSSDNLAFLFAGHTVVNFVGMERTENVDDELAAQLTRLGEGFGEFTITILHTPLDEFHTIEYFWPGMMNANMEAFMLFLEAILTDVRS